MYEQVAEAQITLHNTGHVGFKFVGLGMDPCLTSCLKPGVPIMTPHSVSLLLVILMAIDNLCFSDFNIITTIQYTIQII